MHQQCAKNVSIKCIFRVFQSIHRISINLYYIRYRFNAFFMSIVHVHYYYNSPPPIISQAPLDCIRKKKVQHSVYHVWLVNFKTMLVVHHANHVELVPAMVWLRNKNVFHAFLENFRIKQINHHAKIVLRACTLKFLEQQQTRYVWSAAKAHTPRR